MPKFTITDPAISANYGAFSAVDGTAALDQFAQAMGWHDYADYIEVASRHTGLRSLTATEVL